MRWLIAFTIFFFYSCSPSYRIKKTAGQTVLKDKSLQQAHIGISIFDPATNKSLYSHQSDKYFVPASNTKIPTCYVALKYLPDSLLSYYYNVVSDTIFIQPAGDPSFLNHEFIAQPGFEFLKNFKAVVVDDDGYSQFLGSGWSWNDYQEYYMAQRSLFPLYGNLARISFKNQDLHIAPSFFKSSLYSREPIVKGIAVRKDWDNNSFLVVPGQGSTVTIPFRPDMETITGLLADTLHMPVTTRQLAGNLPLAISSRVKDSILIPMMHRSDNFYAEQCLVMAARQVMSSTSINSIIDSVTKTDFKDLQHKPRWADGSGLSRYNLFTPSSFTAILHKMQTEFGMERLKQIFPAGGEGTISSYYKSYSGRFFAKTGTLSGVVALSGFMYTKKNRLLIFSVLVNNHQSSATDIRKAVEKFLVSVMEGI